MEYYTLCRGIEELIRYVENTTINEWVYVNYNEFVNDCWNANYYIIQDVNFVEDDPVDNDIYITEDGETEWVIIRDLELKEFLEIAMIQDILSFASNDKNTLALEDKVRSIQYYYANDSYLIR